MVTKASEYKNLSKLTFTLPSGAVFELKKLPRSLFFVLADAIEKMKGQENAQMSQYTPEQRKALSEIYDTLLTGCVTSPKIVKENATEDELLIDDIDFKDQAALVNELFRISGMSEASDESRKNSQTPT